jgi:hypothetical protein
MLLRRLQLRADQEAAVSREASELERARTQLAASEERVSDLEQQLAQAMQASAAPLWRGGGAGSMGQPAAWGTRPGEAAGV